MNTYSHSTLWAEASVRFWDSGVRPGDRITRYHQASFAEQYDVSSLTIFAPDWSEQSPFPSDWGTIGSHRGSYWCVTRSAHGHNWSGVTRLDFTLFPPDCPYYFSGILYTGGCNSTFKLRRLTSTHQLTHLIPAKATFTRLPSGVWQADFLRNRKPTTSFFLRSTKSWIQESSEARVITKAVATRFRPAA